MIRRERNRRRVGLGVATFLSLLVHVLLSMMLAVLTLRDEPARVEKDHRRPPPEARAERSSSDFELVVTNEERPRPVHEKPVDASVAKPSLRPDAAERPRPVERPLERLVERPVEDRSSEPVESPVPVELPRAAAAPRAPVDTPTKLSRQVADVGGQPADPDPPVPVPRSVTGTVGGVAAASAAVEQVPKPATRRPSVAPRPKPTASIVRRDDGRGRAEPGSAETPPASIAARRRPAAEVPAAEPTVAALIARSATTAEADDQAEASAEVDPLPVAADAREVVRKVDGPEPSPASAVARPRSRPGGGSTSIVTSSSRSTRPGGGDPAGDREGRSIERPGGVPRVARAEIGPGPLPGDAAPLLPRAAGSGEGPDPPGESAAVAGLVGDPTEPPAGDGPPKPPPTGPAARRSQASVRSGTGGRGRTSAIASRRAGAAVGERADAVVIGGRERGIDGGIGSGEVVTPDDASMSPSRRAIDAVGESDGSVAVFSPPPDETSVAGDGTPAAGDPFATIAASTARFTRPNRGGPRPPVRVRAPEGPGGTEDEAGPQPGITARPNRRPTESVLENDARFLARVAGAALPVDGRVRQVAVPFLQRSPDRRDRTARGAPRPETEQAIERGLAFLARAQLPDGRWSLSRFPGSSAADAGSIESDTAATGLALLCFLGAGYDHFGEVHADPVRRGLAFLRAVQKPDGDLYLESDELSARSARLYSHAIATMALCEAVGMTGDQLLREPAANACTFIAASQHDTRGGWRYTPGVGSDLSVSGWVLLALRSAELAGVEVDRRCFDGVRRLLDTSQSAEDSDTYVYNPYAPDTPEQRGGRRPSASMTAVGLLMRLHTGTGRDAPHIRRSAAKLSAELPSVGSRRSPTRDCYLWYYAAQALYHVGGEAWDRWYGRLHDILVTTQEAGGDADGSWEPGGAVPDRWAAFGGRIYVTALNLLTLEVQYRHLPTYEVLSRPASGPAPARSSP